MSMHRIWRVSPHLLLILFSQKFCQFIKINMIYHCHMYSLNFLLSNKNHIWFDLCTERHMQSIGHTFKARVASCYQCRLMSSCCADWWCHHVVQTDDVIMLCRLMMSSCCADWWCHHVVQIDDVIMLCFPSEGPMVFGWTAIYTEGGRSRAWLTTTNFWPCTKISSFDVWKCGASVDRTISPR